MKPLRMILLLTSLVVALGGVAQASTYLIAPSLPWYVSLNTCIGGARCGGNSNVITVSVQPSAYIDQVVVYAHDGVGDTNNADLLVYVDGVLVGRQDVRESGSTLYYSVGRYGSTVTLQSLKKGTSSGSEETVVVSISIP